MKLGKVKGQVSHCPLCRLQVGFAEQGVRSPIAHGVVDW